MNAAADGVLPNCVLSVYPLTRHFRGHTAEIAGDSALWLTVSDLRQKGTLGMFRYLRSLSVDRVYLPIEDDEGRCLLPVLQILAGLIPARGIFMLGSDRRAFAVARSQVAGSGVHLMRASVHGMAMMRRAGKDVKGLLAARRVHPRPSDKPDILYLNGNLWFGVKAGGSVGHISGVMNGFLDLGYPVTFASAGGQLLVRKQVHCWRIQPPRHFGIPWEYNLYRFHYDFVEQVSKLAARRDFGVIYQRLSVCNFSGVELSRRLRRPLIVEYNGSEVWIARNWGQPLRSQELAENAEMVSLRHAHLVVTISDVLKNELLQRGVPRDRIVTYPNCFDTATFNPLLFSSDQVAELRSQYGIPLDAIVVAFVGTFGQWHGASVLAAAIRHLLDEDLPWVMSRKLHFLFVGDGLKMPEVREVLGPHVNGPHVTFAGLVPQHQAPLYLAASEILSSPHVPNADGSRFFGSPTKLFEYMAMGKAIIASDLDQIGEVLAGSIRASALPAGTEHPSHAPPALLATPGSAHEICKGIKFLVERPVWRQALGANARKLALERYTWPHHVAAIVERMQRLGLASSRGLTARL